MKDLIMKNKKTLIGKVFRMEEEVEIDGHKLKIVNPAIFSGAGELKIMFRCNAPGGFSTKPEGGKFWVFYNDITPKLAEEILAVLREAGVDTKAELLKADLKREVSLA